jgi:hypothetical protein
VSTYSRRTGSEWEARIASHLTDRGTFGGEVFRAPRWGANDKGDLVNTGDFVFEAKAVKAIDLSGFLNETETERINAARRWGVCVIKRRNHPIGKAYAVMQLDQFLDLIEALSLETRLGLTKGDA